MKGENGETDDSGGEGDEGMKKPGRGIILKKGE